MNNKFWTHELKEALAMCCFYTFFALLGVFVTLLAFDVIPGTKPDTSGFGLYLAGLLTGLTTFLAFCFWSSFIGDCKKRKAYLKSLEEEEEMNEEADKNWVTLEDLLK